MKTQKRRNIKKPYTVFKLGNIIISTRIPIIRQRNKRVILGGKESDNEYLQTQIFQNLVSTLGTSNEAGASELKTYLEGLKLTSEKAALLQYVFSKKSDVANDAIFDAVITRKLNMRDAFKSESPENKLYNILLSKVNAKAQVQKIKEEVENSPDIDEKTKTAIISSLENTSGMTISSVSTGALNTMKKGSVLLGNFFAPTIDNTTEKKKWNETNVEILFYDQDHLHYRKGDSMPIQSDDEKRFGDVMIINRPTQYTSTKEYVSTMYASVEDLLAHIASAGENLLCLGDSAKCKKYSVKPKPYTRRVMRIVNKQPQIDVDKKKKS
jgi:hypothetical protein